MESSESDGYEDVMSCEEEGTVVQSQWTARAKVITSTTAAAEVSSTSAYLAEYKVYPGVHHSNV